MSAIFAGMVNQYAQMAFMFLGKAPNPQTGKSEVDIETAKMFIDNLEMLEFKTKGNLSNEEDKFLKSVLTQLRMDFVEALESSSNHSKDSDSNLQSSAGTAKASETTGDSGKESAASVSGSEPGVKGPDSDSGSDEKRKFVKKYD